jgi:hypothetical protein
MYLFEGDGHHELRMFYLRQCHRRDTAQLAKDIGQSLIWRQEIASYLETGGRRKSFFEGAEVRGSRFFLSWIDIA